MTVGDGDSMDGGDSSFEKDDGQSLDLESGVAVHQQSTQPASKPEIQSTPRRDDKFLVKFTEGDPDNPKNFKPLYKAWLTAVLGLLAFAGSAGTSIIVPAEDELSRYLNVSTEVTVLVLSLFVLGFAFGPLFWAPISEVYGRKVSMLPALAVLGLFTIGTAVSKNAPSIFITRFLGGVFGSAPVSNVGAALGDFYEPQYRGIAMTFYAVMVVGGPCLAPIIGAAATNNPHLGWRWTMYLEAIIVFTIAIIALLGYPETYPPVVLKRKAIRMRQETGDARYWHSHEEVKMSLDNIVTKHISRPLLMLTTEPMVTCICLYLSFVYGLLFMMLEVYPIVFREQRHYGPVVSTLPLLGIFVGVLVSVLINILNNPLYIKAVKKNNGRPVPEARLPPMALGGFLLCGGMFWFGWTAAPKYHWIVPTAAGAFIGSGFNIVFQQGLNFLVDSYALYAASALSANTILRSGLACGLPLAAGPMFRNLGVGPAMSVLGGIACLALPVPFIFMKYGLRLRKLSKFAPVLED